jgi:hypothetical protein
MSKANNLPDFLTDLANAIREKKGTTGTINAQDFSSEIASIQTRKDTHVDLPNVTPFLNPFRYSTEWEGVSFNYNFSGRYIWTDGKNTYYSDSARGDQYIFNRSTLTWTRKTWNGLTSFGGENVWTDGENIYYSSGSSQYVLNIETSTWTRKTWNGLTSFNGSYIWTDGTEIYYSNGSAQYVLNKATSTWATKTWTKRL